MIIDCISDLHGFKPQLEGGDLLIIAGDLTAADKRVQYEDFLEWLKKQDYRKKIFISGNHDNQAMSQFDWHGACYLSDSGTEFDRLKIWGSPWSLWFSGVNPHCKAFMVTELSLNAKFSLIPDDIDILITHTPPWHMMDQNIDGYSCGSRSLLEAIDRVKPKLAVFGHIHEQGGQMMVYKHLGPNTVCVNASIMNERYQPVNKPVRVVL